MTEKLPITPENWTSLKLQMCDSVLMQLFSNDKLNKRHSKLNLIYHYTNLSNFISIIEDQTLYSTNISFLNDKKEYKYGVQLLLDRIAVLKNKELNTDILNMLAEHIDLIFKSDRYVTCFSKNGDLLSQWRAYANNGKGVAIGFESSQIDVSMNLILQSKHISYDVNEQIEVIDELLRIIITFFENYKEIFDWVEYGYEWLVANAIVEFLDDILAGYKDPSFFEEQEYRLEYNVDGRMHKKEDVEVHYRASDTAIIPFVKILSKYRETEIDKNAGRFDNIDIDDHEIFFLKDRLPIKEIVIGPSLDFEMNRIAIEDILKKNGYEGVVVKRSSIPYR